MDSRNKNHSKEDLNNKTGLPGQQGTSPVEPNEESSNSDEDLSNSAGASNQQETSPVEQDGDIADENNKSNKSKESDQKRVATYRQSGYQAIEKRKADPDCTLTPREEMAMKYIISNKEKSTRKHQKNKEIFANDPEAKRRYDIMNNNRVLKCR